MSLVLPKAEAPNGFVRSWYSLRRQTTLLPHSNLVGTRLARFADSLLMAFDNFGFASSPEAYKLAKLLAMKINVIERSLDDVLPSRLGAPAPQHRNLDPALHPFAKSREYTRALTAAKLERMFAKPFVDSLEGHNDGVYCMSRDPDRLGTVASGAGDGDIRLWSLPTRETLVSIPRAHKSMVKDITFVPTKHSSAADGQASTSRRRLEDAILDSRPDEETMDDDDADAQETGTTSRFISCSTDKTIKLWDAHTLRADAAASGTSKVSTKALHTYLGRIGFNSVTHHRFDNVFASASDRIDVWDETRSEPIMSMGYGALSSVKGKGRDDAIGAGDHIISVKFNQSDTSILASTSSDRTVCLYDVRSGKATSRLTMDVRANQISWNPLQPPIFLLGSESSDLYTFDMRKMTSATQVFKGHVGSVLSCDWSPTGREFVSGAYDRTVRLWQAGQGKSVDTYHTQRMQRVFSVLYTLDSRFVLSGSDDGNVRIWKARASGKLGTMSTKELSKMEYRDSLREKWKDVGEVGKIERQRFVPKAIHNATRLRREMDGAEKRKEGNRRRHAPKNRPSENPKSERRKGIVKAE